MIFKSRVVNLVFDFSYQYYESLLLQVQVSFNEYPIIVKIAAIKALKFPRAQVGTDLMSASLII